MIGRKCVAFTRFKLFTSISNSPVETADSLTATNNIRIAFMASKEASKGGEDRMDTVPRASHEHARKAVETFNLFPFQMHWLLFKKNRVRL